MRFPSIRKQQEYTVTVPQLCGGLNKSVPAHLIEDHQLSDVKNMWYKDGMLQTRPGAKLCDTAEFQLGFPMTERVELGEKTIVYVANAYGEPTGKEGDTCELGVEFSLIDKTGKLATTSQRFTDVPRDVANVLPFSPHSLGVSKAGSAYEYMMFAGGKVYGVDSEGELEEQDPYVPKVMINGKATAVCDGTAVANGDFVESFNMLTESFECSYTSTGGTACYFTLPEKDMTPLSEGEAVVVKYTNGVKTYEHTLTKDDKTTEPFWECAYCEEGNEQEDGRRLFCDFAKGLFAFFSLDYYGAFPVDASNETNNITFRITRKKTDGLNEIYGMRFATWFGGGSSSLAGGTRLFVGGNEKHPNLMCWSAEHNPLYFPENNQMNVGEASSRITAFGKQGELLIIFKDRELYCTQYIQGNVTADDVMSGAVMDTEAALAVFSLVQLHSNVGCDHPQTIRLCNNRLVWMCEDKVYGLFTSGQYSARNVRELSHNIRGSLENTAFASAAVLGDNYILMLYEAGESSFIKAYVMDFSSPGFVYYGNYGSDEKAQKAVQWYAWDLDSLVGENGSAVPFLFMVRQEPLLYADGISSHNVFSFCEGAADSGYDAESKTYTDSTPIASSFTTKLYNFNRPDLKKAIQQLYLSVRDDEDSVIRVSYLTERYVHEDAFTVTGEGEDGNGYIRTWRLTPNVNLAQAFGIRCDSETGMAVQGILLKYKHQGVVR